jgi:divalent metal cation (Fe/Co/Zn/Cd) transporter
MDSTAKSEADRAALRFAMNLSLAVGLLMFVMKTGAYLLTSSAAILSDAAESVTHVAAVFFAAYSLRLSYRPPDRDHLYGHAIISFFSAGFEGAMIILAALFIIYQSIHKWMTGLQLENLGEDSSLAKAHRTATDIERIIEASLEPRAFVTTHLECATDHDALHPHERNRRT